MLISDPKFSLVIITKLEYHALNMFEYEFSGHLTDCKISVGFLLSLEDYLSDMNAVVCFLLKCLEIKFHYRYPKHNSYANYQRATHYMKIVYSCLRQLQPIIIV